MNAKSSQIDGKPNGCYKRIETETNGRYFLDDPFKRLFLNENGRISIWISEVCSKGPINNFPTHICPLGLNDLTDYGVKN